VPNTYGGVYMWVYVPYLKENSLPFGETGSEIRIYNPSGSGYWDLDGIDFILDDTETGTASAQGEQRLVYKANVAAGHAREHSRVLFINRGSDKLDYIVLDKDYLQSAASTHPTNAMLSYPPVNGDGNVDFSNFDTFWPEVTGDDNKETDRATLSNNNSLVYKITDSDRTIWHTNGAIDFLSGSNLPLINNHSFPLSGGGGNESSASGDPFVTPMIIV
jgi:hypothetical protein